MKESGDRRQETGVSSTGYACSFYSLLLTPEFGEYGGEGMGLSLFGAWVSDFFETSDEVGEGFDFEHFDLREWVKEAKPFRSSLYYVKNREMAGKKGTKKKNSLNTCYWTGHLLGDVWATLAVKHLIP